jgi:predicted Rossmann fold nucleotide-binding protein DprA/Smf involved in DNA uptake
VNVDPASLVALLLTNRIVDIGVKPLSAAEYWRLREQLGELEVLLGASSSDLERRGVSDSDRIAALVEASTAFTFERERLRDQGIDLVSHLDDGFPGRLVDRLGTACPVFLLVAGPANWLQTGGLGIVGSRDASPESLDVARAAAKVAATNGLPVVSGLARGIDQTSMQAALDAGTAVVGVPTEGVRRVAQSSAIRARVHDGELCIASPYGPDVRFSAGNAMGRNKVVYALADRTLVVCSDKGTGGTWEGAKEALRRRFGPVDVWTGAGAGPGNADLVRAGGRATDDVEQLGQAPADSADVAESPTQRALF